MALILGAGYVPSAAAGAGEVPLHLVHHLQLVLFEVLALQIPQVVPGGIQEGGKGEERASHTHTHTHTHTPLYNVYV